MGKIFCLSQDSAMLYAYADYFKTLGHQVFATSNKYKFLLYAKEINPDIFIVDTDEPENDLLFEKMDEQNFFIKSPLLLITKNDNSFTPSHHISFALFKPFDLQKMKDIIDSFCSGNKTHDLLLVENFDVSDTLQEYNTDFSIFKIYNMQTANIYLQKNTPKNIIINLPTEEKPDPLSVPFYVENQQKNKDMVAFLD